MANFDTLLATPGRRAIMQVLIEGIPEVLCTEVPPDPKAKIYSLAFDGANGYLTTATTAAFVTTGDFTIISWVKPTDFANIVCPIVTWCKDDHTKGFMFGAKHTTGALFVQIDGSALITSSLALTAGLWHMASVSVGGATGYEIRFHLWTLNADGTTTKATEYKSVAGDTRANRVTKFTAQSTTVKIGYEVIDPSYFKGRIGFVSVFDRAFTFSETARVAYRILDSKWPSAFWTNLRGQWTLEEGAGTIARDSSANTFHLTTFAGGANKPTWQSDPPFTISYKAQMAFISAADQTLEPRATRTNISGLSFRVLDSADWLTSRLKNLGLAVRQKSAYVFLGFDGLLEDEYRIVVSGAVDSIDPLPGRAYEVKLGDAQRFAKASLPLGKTSLSAAITSAQTNVPVGSLYGFGYKTPAEAAAFASYENYLKIDNEIMKYTAVAGGPAFTVQRGQLGTVAASHANGATVSEILWEDSVVDFTIDFLLRMLLSSTGDACCDTSATLAAGRGAVDLWSRITSTADASATEGRGAGVSLADIDLSTIVTKDTTAPFNTYTGIFYIDKNIDDIKQFLEEQALRQTGAFFFVKTDGRMSVGTWDTPSDSGVSIGQSDLRRPIAILDYSSIINSMTVRYDYSPATGSYAKAVGYEDTNSGKAHGRINPLRMDSTWINTSGGTPLTITDGCKSRLFGLFKNPPTMFGVAVGLSKGFAIEIAQGVRLQHEALPDLTFGARGVDNILCMVIGRTLDIAKSEVRLKLIRIS